jgi:hypothetical protein
MGTLLREIHETLIVLVKEIQSLIDHPKIIALLNDVSGEMGKILSGGFIVDKERC